MKNVLLTGSTGCLGSYLLEELSKKLDPSEEKIILLVRSPDKLEEVFADFEVNREMIEVVEGDLENFEVVKDLAGKADTVFHVAALFDFVSPWDDFYGINVEATRVMVENMREGASLILTSSDGIYGLPGDKKPMTEDHEKDPIGDYHKSKLEQENLARSLCQERGILFAAIRPSNIIGPRDHMTVPQIIEGLKSKTMALIDGGDHTVSLVHPADAAGAHILAWENITEVDGEAFHVASFQPTWKEYLDAFCDELGIDKMPMSVPYFVAYMGGLIGDLLPFETMYSTFNVKFAGKNHELDLTKIKEKLGFEAQYDLEKTVKECVAWYREKYPLGK